MSSSTSDLIPQNINYREQIVTLESENNSTLVNPVLTSIAHKIKNPDIAKFGVMHPQDRLGILTEHVRRSSFFLRTCGINWGSSLLQNGVALIPSVNFILSDQTGALQARTVGTYIWPDLNMYFNTKKFNAFEDDSNTIGEICANLYVQLNPSCKPYIDGMVQDIEAFQIIDSASRFIGSLASFVYLHDRRKPTTDWARNQINYLKLSGLNIYQQMGRISLIQRTAKIEKLRKSHYDESTQTYARDITTVPIFAKAFNCDIDRIFDEEA